MLSAKELHNRRSLRSYTCRPMKKSVFFCVIVGCFVMKVASVHVEAQSHSEKTAAPMLLVANQGDRDLSLIDPSAGKQVAAIPVDGVTGHEVAAWPDGRTAYVLSYGHSGGGSAGTSARKNCAGDLTKTNRRDKAHSVPG